MLKDKLTEVSGVRITYEHFIFNASQMLLLNFASEGVVN